MQILVTIIHNKKEITENKNTLNYLLFELIRCKKKNEKSAGMPV